MAFTDRLGHSQSFPSSRSTCSLGARAGDLTQNLPPPGYRVWQPVAWPRTPPERLESVRATAGLAAFRLSVPAFPYPHDTTGEVPLSARPGLLGRSPAPSSGSRVSRELPGE